MVEFFSVLPILLIIILLVFAKLPAKVVMPLVWLFLAISSFFIWQLEILDIISLTFFGFLEAINIIIIIAGALLVLNTLKFSDALSIIQKDFGFISPDSRIQLVIVGFLFEALLEGLAGFGTPAALVTPLLVSLGFAPLKASILALVYNSVPVVFGASGTPIVGMQSSVNLDSLVLQEVVVRSALLQIIPSILVPFLGVVMYTTFLSQKPSFKRSLEVLPFCLVIGLFFGLVYFLTAYFLGSELPSILASILTLGVAIVMIKKEILTPKQIYLADVSNFEQITKSTLSDSESITFKSRVLAWSPYLLITLLLLITRIPFLPFKNILQNLSLDFDNVFGLEGVSWSFKYAYLPGIFPFALVSGVFFWIYKLPKKTIKDIFSKTYNQIRPALYALLFSLAIVQMMRYTGIFSKNQTPSIVEVLASNLNSLPKDLVVLCSPLVGVLGSFITGSATVSNVLFAGIQLQTAQFIRVEISSLLSLQVVGAAFGNMVSIGNIVAVSAVTGIKNKEGYILKHNLVFMLIYCILVIFGHLMLELV